MRTALTVFSELFSFLAMAAAVFIYATFQNEVPEIRRANEHAVSEVRRDGDRAIAQVKIHSEREIARIQAESQGRVDSYEAEVARLQSEYVNWRTEESKKYESAISELKSEVERLREAAIVDSISAAKTEWRDAEQLAMQTLAAVNGFQNQVDAAMDRVDAAAFASAQPKLDDLDSRLNDLAALQQDIDETVDAIYKLCAGEKCGTVIDIEAWTTTPATTLNAKRAAFSQNGANILTLEDFTLWNNLGQTYAVELEQLDVSPFGRPLAKLPNESDRIVGAYRVRIFEGTGSTDPEDVAIKPEVRLPNEYDLICLDDSRTWRQCDGLRWASFHEGEGYTIALVRSE